MKYKMYKLKFLTGVHFGNNSLDEGMQMFTADTLFSALFLEAMKKGNEYAERLLNSVKNGEVFFSDAFPFISTEYYLPKPLMQYDKKKDSAREKRKNSLSFISASEMRNYLNGEFDVEKEAEKLKSLGKFFLREQVGIYGCEEPEPYQVGIFQFKEQNGLYIIAALKTEEMEHLLSDLMNALAYTGIGGKRSSGLGRFEIVEKNMNTECFEGHSAPFLLLTTSLPCMEELEDALSGAKYQMVKRSGFIQSENYSKEHRKKREMFFFKSGSCFMKKFSGDIYDVSDKEYVKNGKGHAIYRYAKPMFLSLESCEGIFGLTGKEES